MGVRTWWKKFIENLERENSEQFAGKPLDCCNLNDRPRTQVQRPINVKQKESQR